MKLDIVKLEQIDVGTRYREEYGDVDALARSIKENGLINPIAIYSETGEPPFALAAGGRRFFACVSIGMEEVACRIYDHKLSELELRSIELEENIQRKDLEFIEEVRLKREIHELQVAIKGEKTSTSLDAGGHSLRDTAALLGKAVSTVSQDIKLADMMDAFPDADWEKCKNKSEAVKIMNRIEERMIRKEISKRAMEVGGSSTTKKMIDSYIVGDFFEQVKKLDGGVFDLVEIDPPYGIDLPAMKLHSGGSSSGGDKFNINYGSSYNEVKSTDYIRFMELTLGELYRVMNDHSWLICWFGPDPWFETIYNLIIEAGFKTRRLTGKWTKPGGQTNHPDIYLANCDEQFFYAYKGDAVISMEKRGRSNLFDFAPVPPAKKIHPTERPIELTTELLKTFAFPGARIYVPFCGSGNTLRSAYNLDMYPIGVDLGQEYKDGYVTRIMMKGEQ